MAASFCFTQGSCLVSRPSLKDYGYCQARGPKKPGGARQMGGSATGFAARYGASLAWLPERGDQGARQRSLFLPLGR